MNELKKIYEFLEIKITDVELGKIVDNSNFDKIPASEKGIGKFYRSASPGNWQNNFNEKEKEIMFSIMSGTLKKMGYA